MESSSPLGNNLNNVDLSSLRLQLYAEFDNWHDFVAAVDEFQKKTMIKLTITTSKKANRTPSEKRKAKMIFLSDVNREDMTHEMPVKRKFEYKYLKLTCKHYGCYRSTSRGIRPNQSTTKLMCPTYIYGSYDHYKEKFIIKQMHVNCNHELKDEELLLPKLLKNALGSSEDQRVSVRKKYVKPKNRNVLKVPLESPGNLILSVASKIRCNHEANKFCGAMTLTSDDLASIHSIFGTKAKREQNNLIMEWIDVISTTSESSKPCNLENTIQVAFKLPTIDGTLVRVCYKSFLQALRVSSTRVTHLITNHYGNLPRNNNEDNGEITSDEKSSREIETSIANILTSFSKEEVEESPQVIYCDTLDLAPNESTIDDPYGRDSINQMIESSLTKVGSISFPALPKVADNTSNTLNYPIIKMTPVNNGFSMSLDCDFEVTLKGVSIENNGKSLRIFFGTS